MKDLIVKTLSHDTPAYQVMRWAYQPVKYLVPAVRELSFVPRRNRVIHDYLRGNGFKGLQIGCGDYPFPGWLNSDMVGTPGIDFPLNITKPLPLPDGCLDAVYGSEVIEHIERRFVAPFLKEVHRILKPGGVLRLTTPDLKAICEIYLGTHPHATLEEHKTTWLEGEFSPQVWINAFFRNWGHEWVWDFGSMADVMRSVGFSRVESLEPQVTHSGNPELANRETRYGVPPASHCWTCSMILEATK